MSGFCWLQSRNPSLIIALSSTNLRRLFSIISDITPCGYLYAVVFRKSEFRFNNNEKAILVENALDNTS